MLTTFDSGTASTAWRHMGRALGSLALGLLIACGDASTQPDVPPAHPVVGPEDRQRLAQINHHINRGQHDTAIEMIEARLQQDPSAPIFHYTWGVVLGSQDDHQGAIEKFEQEIALYPSHAASHRSLGLAYTRLGQFEASLSPLETCLALIPDDLDCAYQLGRNLSSLGRFDEAETHLRAALARPGPDTPSELGTLYRRRGAIEQAIPYFREALEREPFHLATLLNFGQALVAIGRTHEGQVLLDEHRRRAQLHDQIDHVERKIKGAGPTLGDLLRLARLRTHERNAAAALDAYRQAVAIAPDQPAAVLGYASVLLESGDLEQATRWTIHALTLTPDDPNVHLLLGLVRLHKGLDTEAEQAFVTSRARGAWPAQAWRTVGAAYWEQSRLDEAERAFQTAVQMDDDHAGGHYQLARVHARQGHPERALPSLDRSIALAPQLGDAWMLRGLLRHLTGDPSGAASDLRGATRALVLEMARDHGTERIVERFEWLPSATRAPAFDAFRRIATTAASGS